MQSRYLSWIPASLSYAYDTSKKLITSTAKFSYNMAVATRDTTYQIVSFTSYIFGSSAVQQTTQNTIEEGFQGFVDPLNPSVAFAIMRSSNTRRVFARSAFANIALYMGVVLAYEFAAKGLLYYMMHDPDNKDYTYADFESSWGMQFADSAAKVYFLRAFIRSLVDNMLYNSSIYKAAYDDNKPDPRFLKDCPHGPAAGIQANYMSMIAYPGSALGVAMIENTFPFGKSVIGPMLRTQLYGEAFLEAKLGSVWNCTDDRVKIRKSNIPYSFGTGLSFTFMYNLFCLGTEYLTGVNSSWVRDAWFAVLYEYYIVAALQTKKPLPGTDKRVGFEVFRYSRLLTEIMVKDAIELILPMLKDQSNRGDFLKSLEQIRQFPPVRLLETLFVESDLQTRTDFEKRAAVLQYVSIYADSLVATIDGVLEKRRDRLTSFVHEYPALFPKFVVTEEQRNLLSIIFSEQITNQQLEDLKTYIKRLKSLADDAGYRVKRNMPGSLTSYITDIKDVTSEEEEKKDKKDDSASSFVPYGRGVQTLTTPIDPLSQFAQQQGNGTGSSSALQQNSVFKSRPAPQQPLPVVSANNATNTGEQSGGTKGESSASDFVPYGRKKTTSNNSGKF